MKADLLNLSNWRRYYILSGCFSGGDMKVDYIQDDEKWRRYET